MKKPLIIHPVFFAIFPALFLFANNQDRSYYSTWSHPYKFSNITLEVLQK